MVTPNRRRNDPEDSEAYAHRRKTDADTVLHLHGRIGECEESIVRLLAAQNEMTENMRSLTDSMGRIAGVLEAWNNARGFWTTMKFFAAFAKVMLPIIGVSAAIYAFVKTGQWMQK